MYVIFWEIISQPVYLEYHLAKSFLVYGGVTKHFVFFGPVGSL